MSQGARKTTNANDSDEGSFLEEAFDEHTVVRGLPPAKPPTPPPRRTAESPARDPDQTPVVHEGQVGPSSLKLNDIFDDRTVVASRSSQASKSRDREAGIEPDDSDKTPIPVFSAPPVKKASVAVASSREEPSFLNLSTPKENPLSWRSRFKGQIKFQFISVLIIFGLCAAYVLFRGSRSPEAIPTPSVATQVKVEDHQPQSQPAAVGAEKVLQLFDQAYARTQGQARTD